jgi:hypothetical protein
MPIWCALCPYGAQEGEGFRAAASSRLHRMLLRLLMLDRANKRARGLAWALGQVGT